MGFLYKSVDGISWTKDATVGFSNNGYQSTACSNGSNILTVGSDGYYSINNGTSWVNLSTVSMPLTTMMLCTYNEYMNKWFCFNFGGTNYYYSSNLTKWILSNTCNHSGSIICVNVGQYIIKM